VFVVIRIAMRLGIIIGSLFYFVLFHSIQFQFVCLFVYYVLHITYIKPYTTTRKVKKYKKSFLQSYSTLKNVPTLASCSFNVHGQILRIFNRGHQHTFNKKLSRC